MDYRTLSKRKSEVSRGLHSELKDREQGLKRCRKSTGVRHMYTHMTPNHTLYDVAIPLECQHIRRFTSDGKYLITFTPCCHGIRLYSFINTTYTPATATEASAHHDFNHFFKLKYLSMLSMPNGHKLNVDFCLITKDQKYMILNSVSPWDGLSLSAAPVVLDIAVPLSDFAFYTVNIETGELVDQHVFHSDYIHIVDHAGVSLYEDQFAVLSIQTQTIHLFQISESGKLCLQQSLGTFLRSDDASILAMQLIEEQHYQELQQPTVAATDSPANIPRDILDQYIHVHLSTKAAQSQYTNILTQMLPVDEVRERPATTDELYNLVENGAATFLTREQLQTMIETVHNSSQVNTMADVERSSLPLDDEHNQLSQETNGSPNQDQKHSLPHSGLTQAMLSFLYKLFSKQTRGLGRQYFYSNYNWFISLKMWRMQLIGPDQLLIKLTRMPPEFALLRSDEKDSFSPEDERTMFVIFDLAESRIIDMFENCSNKVEGLMLKSADALRNVTPTTPYESTPGMSESEREYFKKKVESWSRADKGVSHQDAMQKLSLYLPRQPNAQPQCPYFDLSLFRYPEKMIAFQNWTRTTLDIISFYCRSTNLLRFRLDARKSPDNATRSPLTMTMTIPNPQYPFAITRRVITTINETQNVNFHVRM